MELDYIFSYEIIRDLNDVDKAIRELEALNTDNLSDEYSKSIGQVVDYWVYIKDAFNLKEFKDATTN